MKLTVIGRGSFGNFLVDLLAAHFEIREDADSVLLAVPLSAYGEIGKTLKDKHLINVCSVQKPSMDALLKYTDRVTGIHPLFGQRTPAQFRNSILTHSMHNVEVDRWYHDSAEADFLNGFSKVSSILAKDEHGKPWTPESHDVLMAKTHLAALIAGKQAQVLVERAASVPDEFLPHSFRVLKQFVKTMDDMPAGTVESILANPY